MKGFTGVEDWPEVNDRSPAAWRRAVDVLVQGHLALRQALSRFPEDRLNETVPGKEFPFYVLIHGAVQHDLYHAGQIVLLKKAKA